MLVSRPSNTSVQPIVRKSEVSKPGQSPGSSGVLLPSEARSGKRELLFDSFISQKQKIPKLESSGPVANFRSIDALRLLALHREPDHLSDPPQLSQRFTEFKVSRFQKISDSLKKLGNTVSNLLFGEGLNPKTANSSRPNFVQAKATKASPLANFQIRATGKAQGNRLVSDAQDLDRALGLSGSFKVNGANIQVQSTDSIFDLKNKINFGEDLNQNGILDRPEDINNNGIVERRLIVGNEFGAGFLADEDQNGNGVLDSGEDLNDNDRLDGGTSNTAVLASVTDGRLVLQSLKAGSNRVDLEDDDGLLLQLGFFQSDSKGNAVIKEYELDDSNPPKNLIQEPTAASLDLDGRTFTSDSNRFSGQIEGTEIILKKTSEKTAEISISLSISSVADEIESLFDQFNESVLRLNDVLKGSLAFERDPDVQRIRNDLTRAPQKNFSESEAINQDIERIRPDFNNPGDTGIKVVNTEKNTVQEIALTSIVQRIKSGIQVSNKTSPGQIFERLNEIGIRTLEDDTFQIDRAALEKSLKAQPDPTIDLFADPVSGLIPVLEQALAGILQEGVGDLQLKEEGLQNSPVENKERLNSPEDLGNITGFEGLIKNLITIV
jgi:flagellar capping protein FliD